MAENHIQESLEVQFGAVQKIILYHRTRALQNVNEENLQLSWEVGHYVSARLKSSEWGSKVVTQLSEYLRRSDPTMKGFSRMNLYRMVNFYESYSCAEFTEQIATLPFVKAIVSSGMTPLQIAHKPENKIVSSKMVQLQSIDNEDDRIVSSEMVQLENAAPMPQILTLVNWTSHIEILSSCRSIQERIFYMLYANKERLNVQELKKAIAKDAYTTVLSSPGSQSVGFKQTYPNNSYDFKDRAILDFLGLPAKHTEKQLQNGILEHMKEFILELGRDFIFMGSQYPLEVGGETYKIDLLFFHRGLQCIIALELKSTAFKPSYMGQLEFYLEALDRDVKLSNENPSIGILLCASAKRQVVEYALSRSLSPTMVAEYKRQLIPKEVFQRSLDEFCSYLEKRK
ncbi:PDDEXK nuclease domain-containing protein [Bacteroides fragilis]|uniref:PDDEXK nuclease domain-containing protein n=1 Tax=Bacteroides fragilis TaxID=817 RepID=UPI00189E96CC|nr:PDDEXK nuclease domain-containing protein [Bacteroides fragilis]